MIFSTTICTGCGCACWSGGSCHKEPKHLEEPQVKVKNIQNQTENRLKPHAECLGSIIIDRLKVVPKLSAVLASATGPQPPTVPPWITVDSGTKALRILCLDMPLSQPN